MGLADERFESDAWLLPAVQPDRVALVGLRSLDVREQERIRELGIKAYTMSDIDRVGIERAIRESLAHIAGPGFVHVSFDMDSLDPEVAPGVGTPVRGGLSYREAHRARARRRVGARGIARGRRGESDPRPRERDRCPRGRAGGERTREDDPLIGELRG
jgi:arginase family enzyme